jgi:hypothetical protein
VVDRRVLDATAALAAAQAAAAKLHDKLDAYPPGAAEVADLTKDWGALQERMRRLAAPDAAGSGPADGLAAHATILLGRARAQLVDLPLQWIAADLGPQLDRVRLAQLAGETDRARAMAISTRAWLRRAADDLERRLTLMMGLNLASNGMIVSDAWVRRIAAGEELPPEQRAALLDRLAAADTALAAGLTLADLAAATRDVGATETKATRDRAEALKARVKRSAKAAGDEMSTDPMDVVMHEASLVAHPTVEQKAAALGHMLEVWRGRLGWCMTLPPVQAWPPRLTRPRPPPAAGTWPPCCRHYTRSRISGRPICRSMLRPPSPPSSRPYAAIGAIVTCNNWWRRPTR